MESELYDHYIAGGLMPEEATLAVENAVGKTIQKNTSDTLLDSFVFSESPQGSSFWYDIVERIGK